MNADRNIYDNSNKPISISYIKYPIIINRSTFVIGFKRVRRDFAASCQLFHECIQAFLQIAVLLHSFIQLFDRVLGIVCLEEKQVNSSSITRQR